MIAVATTDDELAGVCDRLRALGVRPLDVVAPSDTRRVVLAAVDDEWSAAGLVVSLRAEGAMAVTRPDGGAALRAWFRDTRPVTFGGRLSVCQAWSEHDRSDLPGLIELGLELVSHLSPGGWLAAGGISPSQCSQVVDFLHPLVEVERRTSGEWSSVVLVAPPLGMRSGLADDSPSSGAVGAAVGREPIVGHRGPYRESAS